MIGLLLAALGVTAAWTARSYPGGAGGVPGSDLYPMALGVLLALVGLGIAVSATRSDNGETIDLLEPRAMAFILLIVIYAFAFEIVGFSLATLVFLFAAFAFVGGAGLVPASIVALLATGTMWFAFVTVLGVGLPQGVFG
ncbi:tripartite tricarboxylate transporter TctB family protein [Terrihabitans sp. B22-R8]|uniref:tripartite tricarboxylate transporter TctB family protein n=1 Tax=Terrihabitans sp. B22-R8 TaxID=3425128 RepID=UPI00403C1618